VVHFNRLRARSYGYICALPTQKPRKKRLSLRREFEQTVWEGTCQPGTQQRINHPLGKSKEMLLQNLKLNRFLQISASALLKMAQGYTIISGVFRTPVII
jgi:hypothetical protein